MRVLQQFTILEATTMDRVPKEVMITEIRIEVIYIKID